MKNRTRTGLVWLLALLLFVSVAASAGALSSRIRYYTAVADVDSMIPLVPEYVTLDELRAAAAAKAEKNAAPMAALLSVRSPERRISPVNVTYCAPDQNTYFSVSADNTIWDTNTKLEIFKTSYEDGQGNITVASSNGDKVIAPGTENSCSFMLKNEFSVPMDYTVSVNVYYTPDELEIPILCRLSRYDGKWLAGDTENWLEIPAFDGSGDIARMAENSYVTYTLDWQWPYEGDDALDTYLSRQAAQEDITFTIEIITTAEADFGSGGEGGDPVRPDPEPDTPVPGPDQPVPGPDQPVPGPDQPGTPDPEPEPQQPVTPVEPDVGQELPPKTGDENDPGMWMLMAAGSFFLLLVLLFWREKDEESEKAEARKQ